MKKRFNWSNFDLEFLNSVLNNPATPESKRPTFIAEEAFELASFVDSLTPYPTRQFVSDYRREIEDHLLIHQPDLVMAVFGNGRSRDPRALLQNIAGRKMGEMLANRYIVALNRIGLNDPDWNMSEYVKPVTIDLKSSAPVDPQLYDFQKDAVENLKKFASDRSVHSGFIVIPTSGGKTRIAVTFLLQDLIAQGYQVIWLAHRHILIDQAADQFKRLSPLIREKAPAKRKFRFMCASTDHGTIKAASESQDVMILSVQTAVRNLVYLKKNLKKKVIVVVDEAHHSIAPSYRRIVEAIRKKRPDTLLLGLTATPIRMNDGATQDLYRMFEGHFIYEIGMSELIKRGMLAQPNFTHVQTSQDFESSITLDEGRYIDRFGELPSSLIQKIALSKQRNQLILRQYFQRSYGKTLIFALNIVHAVTLTDELKRRGVRCDCVYSGKDNNSQIIRAFTEGRLDVLVNVNILTEGVDVPDIETVFLTRPTHSESLLMQMIGRGMRGPLAGGTETVEIVDFIDQWDVFARWLDPEFMITGEPGDLPPGVEYRPRQLIEIPWHTIRAIYRSMGSSDGRVLESQTIPLGWFTLADEGKPFTLLVFENQLSGYVALLRDRSQLRAGPPVTAAELSRRYFSDMGAKPLPHWVEVFWNHLRSNPSLPHFCPFINRREVDAYRVADSLRSTGDNLVSVTEALFQEHGDMIQELYVSLEDYRERIFTILHFDSRPDTEKIAEMPLDLIPFRRDNPHDLAALYEEVKQEMREHLGDCARDTGRVEWTQKPFQSFFGRYFSHSGNIEINCILNSSDVPVEVIKFLLYHEMLHRRHWHHDKVFRQLEHQYPDYPDRDRFLDADFGNFHFEY